MNVSFPPNFFSAGQYSPESILSFEECLGLKDYLTAYRIILGNPFAYKVHESQLISVLTENDLNEDIFKIYDSLEAPFNNSFLQNVAHAYARLNNRPRVLEILEILPYGDKKKDICKIFYHISSAQEKDDAILSIVKNYDKINYMDDGINIVKNFNNPNLDNILLLFGHELIYEKRWDDCITFEDYLTHNKEKFVSLVKEARVVIRSLERPRAQRVLFRA